MAKHRKLLISILLFAGITAAACYWLIYRKIPPAAVRMLPEGDLLFYADLRPIHFLGLDPSKPVQLEGDYRQFVEQTGIQFERDLDQVAMSRRDTADAHDVESSEIFVGRFDRSRLSGYLEKSASQTENYRGHTIYSIPNQGHTVRACVLDDSRVAVTNMVSAEPMHGIIDGRQSSRSLSLLDEYFGRIPVGSLAWMIDRFPANSEAPQLPGGFSFGFLENTVAVVSLRYTDALLARADVYAASDVEARRVMDSANTFLLMYRSVGRSLGTGGSDPDVKAALDSIQVQQKGSAAVFTARFSQRFLKKVFSGTSSEGPFVPASPSPAAVPQKGRQR